MSQLVSSGQWRQAVQSPSTCRRCLAEGIQKLMLTTLGQWRKREEKPLPVCRVPVGLNCLRKSRAAVEMTVDVEKSVLNTEPGQSEKTQYILVLQPHTPVVQQALRQL